MALRTWIRGEGAPRGVEDTLAHADGLYNLARYLTQDPGEAEDLVQETYLRALRGWHEFAPSPRIHVLSAIAGISSVSTSSGLLAPKERPTRESGPISPAQRRCRRYRSTRPRPGTVPQARAFAPVNPPDEGTPP